MQKFIVSSLLLGGLSAQAHAETENSTTALPDMVVTATRSEVARNQLSAATTVYTREDIERKQAKTLPDLLRGTTGLDITEQGGYGKITSIFMRGTNSDHVLVLIDGIKVGSVSSGTSPFQFMPIDQIERVEIIRGPQSSLYGSEAMGGVIQIFARKGAQKETPSVSLDAGGGAYDTVKVSGNVSGKWRNSWYSLGASHVDTQGFNARQPIPGPYGFNQPDRDGYHNTAMNARAGHRFDNNAEIEAFFMRNEGETKFDAGFGGDHSTIMNQVVGLTGSMDFLENWRSTLRLGQSRDDADTFDSAQLDAFQSRYNSTRWNASWLNELRLSDDHQLTIGSDYRLDELESSDVFTKTSRYDVGVFGELHSRILDNHFLNASLRWDKNQASGDYVTGNVGWRYNWDHGISLLANFGNAFKAPSFNQLYYPNYGNPNLRAEEETSVETGIAGQHDWGQWELRAYHTNIDHLIVSVTDPVTFNSHPENVDKAQIDGIEAELSTELFGWNSKLSMNLLSPVNRETDKRLPRRADKTLSFNVYRSFGAWDVGGNVLAQGYRYDNAANTTQVAGYVTVDLRTAYHINKNWMLSAQLNNVLDKTYQTVATYNTAERNFFFAIHYNN